MAYIARLALTVQLSELPWFPVPSVTHAPLFVSWQKALPEAMVHMADVGGGGGIIAIAGGQFCVVKQFCAIMGAGKIYGDRRKQGGNRGRSMKTCFALRPYNI